VGQPPATSSGRRWWRSFPGAAGSEIIFYDGTQWSLDAVRRPTRIATLWVTAFAWPSPNMKR
jgi:hypothetical protein